jgi:pteridine reductase
MQKNQQVALITGAARRIGAAIATNLHAQGLNVVVHYNQSKAQAIALCEGLNKSRPYSAVAMFADLAVADLLEQLVKDAAAVWGRLDVLINNAARFYRTRIGETTRAAWDDLINSNLTAPFFLTQAAAPYLAKQQGCVINIADVHGQRPMKEYSAYCISKAGLIMLTQAFAKELAPAIRVNAIALGPTVPAEGENEISPAVATKIIARTPLARVGALADVVQAVEFFVSGASYTTGQVLAVDGGRSLMI